MTRFAKTFALTVALAVGLTGCMNIIGAPDKGGLADGPTTLRVLAGSEVKDLLPLLEDAGKQANVTVALDYVGTLEGTEMVASGAAAGKYDAVWFPNNRYLSLLPGAAAAVTSSVKIMNSPVVLGLTPPVASRLGWDHSAPTWAEVAEAASGGQFTYGMTNPAASNSGFSALVAVATALSGTGAALSAADIESVSPKMARFFSGQKLTAGSSGYLADTFLAGDARVDGIINYESVLMGLNTPEPLTIVTPTDGVVTSDYPLTLLASADATKKDVFDRLTEWLTSEPVQRRIVSETFRRPGVPGIETGDIFPPGVLFETPFPNTLDVATTLISTYLDAARSPAQTIFVLDTSGSMSGDRLRGLTRALTDLAGADTSTAGGFAAFRARERVTLIPFSSQAEAPRVIEVPASDKSAAFAEIREFAEGLRADGGTAIYDSLADAYDVAVQQRTERADTFVSVVLMTDGQNSHGSGLDDFTRYYRAHADEFGGIPTFVVLFGDSDEAEMSAVAQLTGGRVFDGRGDGLASAFKDIRGYQ